MAFKRPFGFFRPCVHALLHSIVKISGAAERGAAGTALALRLPPVMVGLFSGRVHAVVAAVGQRGRVLSVRKRQTRFESSLCLSRACLGTMMPF